MPADLTYQWKRYWVKKGEHPAIEDGLFVDPSAGIRWLGPDSNGYSLRDLNDVPCLILLGDVGMGKSTTVEKVAQEIKAALAGQQHAVLYQDLKRLSETQIERCIFQSPEIHAWVRGEHKLTLFLDSLDECWRRIEGLELLIAGELERRISEETQPLYLRLTCRSAEWRGDAGKALDRLFSNRTAPSPPVQIFVLAPLSANNVREAAIANKLDADHLLGRIVAKRAQALASHPITFKMLLQLYEKSGDFPTSRVELYRNGCLRLCADDNVAFSTQQCKTTSEQRLVIASRLAALGVFTNRLLINGDSERSLSRVDVLEPAEFLGFTEEPVSGQRAIVDRDTAIETLQTGLFAERIEGAQSWRHQSYAEFLAAQYLKHRGMPTAEIVALLTDTSDNTRRIIPQLEETACWVADIVPSVWVSLVTSNADIFLRCDSHWTDNQRVLLVKSYLELVRRHEVAEINWQLKHIYSRLSHPGLADQLRPVIVDRSEDPLVRETAIDIAGYCALSAAATELIAVFVDTGDIFRVRKHAAIALKEAATDGIRVLLKQEDVMSWTGDMDDDLKGYYLQILWPSHMTLDELLPLLPPKKQKYTGSYKMFLQYELPKSLSDNDLPRMIDWLRENDIDFDILGDFGYLPSKVFARSLGLMHHPSTRDAVLRLLSFDEQHLHRLWHGHIKTGEITTESRLNFWEAVVNSDLDITRLLSRSTMRSEGLLSPKDTVRLICRYRGCSDLQVRARWRRLIFLVFSFEDSGALELLSELAQSDPAMAEDLAAHTSCRVVPDEENWVREDYMRERARVGAQPAIKPSLPQVITRMLDDYESGKIEAYCKIFDVLDWDPEGSQNIVALGLRFSEGKVWKSLTAEVQKRILHAAPAYLNAQSVEEEKVRDRQQWYLAYGLLNPLLVLLFDEHRHTLHALTDDLWGKWIGVFFAYSSRRNGSHEEAYSTILSLAYSKAKQPFLTALRRHLAAGIDNDSERRIIWHLSPIWSNEFKDILLDLFYTRSIKASAAQDVFQLLVSQEPRETENLLASFIAELDGKEACSIHVPSAMVILMKNFSEEWVIRFLQRIQTDLAFGHAVLRRLIYGGYPADWISKIPPKELAEFWEWLTRNYPGDPYEKDERGGEVTLEHDIYHFRNGIFSALARSGTPEACGVMVGLMRRRPDDFWLGNVLADMRNTRHRNAWVRTSPSALMQVLASTDKRLIQTAGELHGVVLESLRRFENELHGVPPSMELWNETNEGREKFWQPKDEMNLSNCLKRFLERDLSQRGVIAGREVQVRPRLGNDAAQLVDLEVRAIPFGEDGRPAPPVSVIVEVKCAWNSGVLLDMQHQLYDRYLNNSDMHFGIYAVAYFTCNAWNWQNDARKNSGESCTEIADLRRGLSNQAMSITNSEKRIDSIVIDARLNLT